MEGFKEKEGTAGVASEFPHKGSRTLVREDAGNEKSLGGGKEPD